MIEQIVVVIWLEIFGTFQLIEINNPSKIKLETGTEINCIHKIKGSFLHHTRLLGLNSDTNISVYRFIIYMIQLFTSSTATSARHDI